MDVKIISPTLAKIIVHYAGVWKLSYNVNKSEEDPCFLMYGNISSVEGFLNSVARETHAISVINYSPIFSNYFSDEEKEFASMLKERTMEFCDGKAYLYFKNWILEI